MIESLSELSLHTSESPLVVPLDIGFKGGRDYLHGTDIYDTVTALVSPQLGGKLAEHQLTLHKLARTRCNGIFFTHPTPPLRRADAAADFAYRLPGGHHACGYLLETDIPVSQERPYDEDAVTALGDCRDGMVSYRGGSPRTAIEVVVALTKHLHLRTYPEASGKWVFSKLELGQALPDLNQRALEIHLRHNFNFRLTKSEILVSGQRAGWIYFSLIRS